MSESTAEGVARQGLEEMHGSIARRRREQRRTALRDGFAGDVLRAIVWGYSEGDPGSAKRVAETCYEFADAMLAARGEVQ